MASSSTVIFLTFFLLLSSSAFAFNITKMLNQFSDFSTFNNYLTQTGLADQINSRRTITVLAVDNGAAGALSGRPDDVLKRVMSVHVVLDYYGMDKISNLKKKSILLTTLFQSSGLAIKQQGFLNLSKTSPDHYAIGSAVPGSSLGSNVVKMIISQPYNISVLQVSSVIFPEGIENLNPNATAAPKPQPPAATPKAAPTPAKTPAVSPATDTPAEAPSADTPAPAAETPDIAPAADTPSADTPAPAGDGPAAADGPSDANAPGSEGDSDTSSGSRLGSCLVAVVAAFCMAAAI